MGIFSESTPSSTYTVMLIRFLIGLIKAELTRGNDATFPEISKLIFKVFYYIAY